MSGGAKRKSQDFGGSNAVVVRPTPAWQKGLGNFFKKKVEEEDSGNTSEKGWFVNMSNLTPVTWLLG